MSDDSISQADYGIAFALTAGAGLSTAIGSAFVLLPSRLHSPRLLGGCLGLAAGVMIYVSFVEIFFKSLDEYELHFDEQARLTTTVEDYDGSSTAYHATTATFFAGIILTWLLDLLIHFIYSRVFPEDHAIRGHEVLLSNDAFTNGHNNNAHASPAVAAAAAVAGAAEPSQDRAADDLTDHSEPAVSRTTDVDAAASHLALAASSHQHGPTCTDMFEGRRHVHGLDLLEIERIVDDANAQAALEEATTRDISSSKQNNITSSPTGSTDSGNNSLRGSTSGLDAAALESGAATADEPDSPNLSPKRLLLMALAVSVAVSLHNFPEGLATFLATAEDASVGAPIAIAIAVHNIPEGLAVSLPLLLATKSKWKAFFWGSVSGLAEPLAGGIGWLAFSSHGGDISHLAYALLFGLVSGIMISISLRELLPTARAYDPNDTLVTKALFVGMLIMAASLMLFKVAS